jgi:hypothetical protein
MTSFASRAARAIARSRGHLRKAEEFHSDDATNSRDFAVAKANSALQIGVLHEATRSADAQEALAAAQILQLDPEVLGISPELEIAAGDKLVAWMHTYTEPKNGKDSSDDDE